MDFKKIGIIFLMFLIALTSANAVTTLNSCGKNSGWVAGETYIINFTNVPSSYINDYCFKFNRITINDLKFYGDNQEITYDSNTAQIDFFQFYSTSNSFLAHVNYFIIEDINLNYRGSGSMDFIGIRGGALNRIRNSNISNIKLNNIGSLLYNQYGYSDGDIYKNITMLNGEYVYEGNPTITSRNYDTLIYDSIFDVIRTEFNTGNYARTNNHIYNSVFFNSNGVYLNVEDTGLIYHDSIREANFYTDSNDNNIADSGGDSFNINPVISTTINGYNFIQDFAEGDGIYSTHINNNYPNVYINDEVIPGSIIGGALTNPNGQLSTLLGTTIIDSIGQTYINTGLDCSILSTQDCFIQDNAGMTTQRTDKFKPLLVSGIGLINAVNISKVGTNNAIMIGNAFDSYSSGFVLSNSNLIKSDNNFKGANNYFVKFKGNALTISDNTFSGINSLNGAYEYIDLESTTPNQNIITRNIFTFTDNFGTASIPEIFTNNSKSTFFNNYVGAGIEISSTFDSQLYVNVLDSIEYNGKIYSWYLGNYYVDNTGCVDIDTNDICDSPYINGAFTDNYPLAVYPFDYLGNLATADTIIDNLAFNVSILNIAQNQTFNLNSDTEGILFQYSHDSSFKDLTCDLKIDGVIEDTQSPLNGITIDYTHLGTWINKTYALEVNCYNDYQNIISTEYLFNVLVNSGTTPGNNNNNNNNNNNTGNETIINNVVDVPAVTGSDIIDFNSIDNTNDNAGGFLSDIGAFILNVGTPVAIVIIIMILFLAIVRLIF